MAIPELRVGVHAYLSNQDGTVHKVAVIDRQYIVMECSAAGLPFGHRKPGSKVLPTIDPVTCLMCIAESES